MTSNLTAGDIEGSGSARTLGRAVEVFPIALTTEALALGWLRQRQAPHGALVLADREIAARTRSGKDLNLSNVLAFSVILRPKIAVDYQDIMWAVGLLSAQAAYEGLGIETRPWWPETLLADDIMVGHVRVETQLSPGMVESSVLTYRLGFNRELDSDSKLAAIDLALISLEARLAQPPTEISDAYGEKCALRGKPIRVDLRPSGAVGGIGDSIDERGGFGVAATSGSTTRYGVDQLRDIRLR